MLASRGRCSQCPRTGGHRTTDGPEIKCQQRRAPGIGSREGSAPGLSPWLIDSCTPPPTPCLHTAIPLCAVVSKFLPFLQGHKSSWIRTYPDGLILT